MIRSFVLVLGSLVTATVSAQTTPFTAKLTFSETISAAAPGSGCVLSGQLHGSGNSTYLGLVTATSEDCINPRDASFTAFSFSSAAPTGVVLVAANGDLLHLRYSGTLAPRPNAPHVIAGAFVITGGTGRFAGATGSGSVSGSESINPLAGTGQGQVVLTGTIER